MFCYVIATCKVSGGAKDTFAYNIYGYFWRKKLSQLRNEYAASFNARI